MEIDYEKELNDARINDGDGDLSYLVHQKKALNICVRMEHRFLTEKVDLLLRIKELKNEKNI